MTASNTVLVSLYLRAGPNLSGAFLAKELSASSNIKSKQTRTGVQTALKQLQRELKVCFIFISLASGDVIFFTFSQLFRNLHN